MVFDPLIIYNDKYDKDDYENNFSNIVNIPNSEYKYLSNLCSPNANTLSIFNLNIRPIPKNLQYFTDTLIYNNSILLNIIVLTEIRLNSSLASYAY